MADVTRTAAPWRAAARRQRGFTLVEVTVSIAMLLVGVLGTASLIDGANATTVSTKAREGATALNRELVEISRSIPYAALVPGAGASELQARPSLADSSSDAGYTIERRGFVYAAEIDVCSMDDPKDGLGAHDGAVTFCADSQGPGTGDRNPDDYKRVAITLSWDPGARDERARQTTLVANPAGGLGPSVTRLSMTSPASSPITTDVNGASFSLTTSATPASVTWSIDGATQGSATGSGTSWSFEWPLHDANGTPTFPDGTYLVSAEAHDDEGRSGVPQTLTVTLNRFLASPPSGFAGGRNGNGSDVDLEWHASGEGDVVGYRVYRSDATGARGERACPVATEGADAFTKKTSCVDQGAPAGSGLHYVIVALDTDTSGALREGEQSSPLPIVEGNTAPAAPAGLTACDGGEAGCVYPDGTIAPSGTTVLTWTAPSDPDGDSVDFYRIYRDGTGYADRYDRLFATGTTLTWVDRAAGSGSHDYSVTAVDTKFAESLHAGPVTK